MKAEEFSRRPREVDGWPIIVESYKLGDVYYCTVSSADPGARFARSHGPSREEAERVALEKAARWLGRTRRFLADPQKR